MEDYFDSDMLIVVGISIMDLIYNLTSITLGITRFYLDFTQDTKGWLCVLSGTLFFNSCLSAFDLIVALTILRHLVIVNDLKIRSWVWLVVLFVIGLLTWIPSLTLIDFMEFESSSAQLFCNYSNNGLTTSVLVILNHLKMVLGFVILIGCLISITIKYNTELNRSMMLSLRNLNKLTKEEAQVKSEYNKLKFDINLKLIGMIVVFIVCFFPEIIMNMVHLVLGTEESSWEEAILIMLDSLTTIANPIFVLYINERTLQTFNYLKYKLKLKAITLVKSIFK
ncbi:hypothetical protein CONCODRAFT_11021 [Conidiobolus coronatus NRRL 28638]|uniref:G-protein coupled receptors family 1 profile domain-containing protein n=1 Tax=Conidiobolus coronatus (strain ATCC 28846 / CBS 209.66 / NRRL 28638) TaxID=796925 RepID=A0A137NW60_CONC2|nr:hypothetical protein CONCODRAFT_11021 [Conidiobolus coronatus NRRL 28638]|eukprot:KXN67006.1 hypothetical protein CONCODRAFT_11021 [Conidiobolus coronatus NRRL 28638]